MSLNLDKSTWKRVALWARSPPRHTTGRPDGASVDRFLAGEHIDTGCLGFTAGVSSVEIRSGPHFYQRFQPGHVLYGSRRTYLRKVAVADFEGITGERRSCVESNDRDVLLQEFLPFVMIRRVFHEFAIRNSRVRSTPYLNWAELDAYEFDLPPLDEQKRIADLLWAFERHRLTVTAEIGGRWGCRMSAFGRG